MKHKVEDSTSYNTTHKLSAYQTYRIKLLTFRCRGVMMELTVKLIFIALVFMSDYSILTTNAVNNNVVCLTALLQDQFHNSCKGLAPNHILPCLVTSAADLDSLKAKKVSPISFVDTDLNQKCKH